MRQGVGCVLMLAGSILAFTVIGSLAEYAALAPGQSMDLRPVWLALGGALTLYAIGVVLLTAISRPDRPRRRLPWRRDGESG
jgi:hypothetical protein